MIIEKDVSDLVRAIKAGKSRFAFFIGAGTSKDSGIPLSSTLVEQWRGEQYAFKKAASNVVKPLEDWVSEKETELDKEDSKYGFWFEQRYPAREDRRYFIEQLVEKATPTFGLIALAATMADGWIPVTLTTNFDDLLYDSFYLFLEQKPLLINHDALASQMRITVDRPKIIKLHGDYLYDNLKNTGPECKRLEESMAKAFSQCLAEYGLVVVGYAGQDRSIMDILSSLSRHYLPYGLWWCVLDSAPLDELPQLVPALLQKDTNRFLVRISGSEDLLLRLWSELDIRAPREKEIQDRTNARLQILRRALTRSSEVSTDKSRSALKRYQTVEQLFSSADRAIKSKLYNKAIEAYDKAIELDPEDAAAYYNQGLAYFYLKQYERAISDYDKAIELDPEDAEAYTGSAEVLLVTGEVASAKKRAAHGLEHAEVPDDRATALMLLSLAQYLLAGEKMPPQYKALCSQKFRTDWDFTVLDNWLTSVDLEPNEKAYVEEVINLLRQHEALT